MNKKTSNNSSINSFEFRIINASDTNFIDVCDYVEKNINIEDLYINGGTLQLSNLTYKALF